MIGRSLADEPTVVTGLLYGKEGVGKSTDIARLSRLGRVLVINAEGGFKKEALTQRGVIAENVVLWPDSPADITFEAIEEVAAELESELRADRDSWVGVGIDSSTEVHQRLLKQANAASLARAAALGKARDRFNISVEDHGAASSMNRDMIRLFRNTGLHVFCTALERRDVDQETGTVTYGPALGPSAARDLMGIVDILGIKTVEEIGGETFWIATFAPMGVRRGKDRYGMLPRRMVNPYADRIIAYIKGELTKENDPDRARIVAAMAGENAQTPEQTIEAATTADPEEKTTVDDPEPGSDTQEEASTDA